MEIDDFFGMNEIHLEDPMEQIVENVKRILEDVDLRWTEMRHSGRRKRGRKKRGEEEEEEEDEGGG